ncbi:MAG: hypothetical protein EOP85_10635 [Verrucomicrobiaceae bacterium]|nr:MAG: hypothetical protein EOP85_10635 [Verrucomicrobiaceae bacterium]
MKPSRLSLSRPLCAAVLSLGIAVCADASEMRVFRSADGKPLKASFEGLDGDTVTLKREDGKFFELSKDKLSPADQAYVQETSQRAGNEAAKLNEVAGHPIASAVPFAERQAEEIAKGLQVRPESRSKFGRSWRLYAAYAKNYTLFGTMPYSVALYADQEGRATSISIVYSNKGDFGSTAGFGQDHFSGGSAASSKTLGEAMEKDEKIITEALTSVLGVGKVQRYGEGGTRRKITRWDWNGHAFLLSNEEGEYVSLGIVSTAMADAGGRSTRVTDAEIKQRLVSSIVREENGDVHLAEIPMVDQGPKGYCAPATFERAMRTMGLEADMYLLAMVGQTAAGGGTSVGLLLENVKHQVTSKGRRIKEDQLKELRIRDIKRYIDEGIPVMWTMCSMEQYNKIADKNTEERAKVTDWDARAATLAAEHAELAKAPKPESNYHICMITGYNEKTQEIAVSDSWGARFELRWVPLAAANWASNGGIFLILP